MARVALIDDAPDSRLLVSAMLADTHAVRSFASGGAALAALQPGEVDLVLLDISLPDMPGPAVLQALRSQGFGAIPVIALTAHDGPEAEARFLGLGFDAYVAKPIRSADALSGPIARLLGAPAETPLARVRRRLQAGYRRGLSAHVITLRGLIGALVEGWQPEAAARARQLAHQLHGSGAGYGLPALSEAARAAEHATDTALVERLSALLAALEQARLPDGPGDADRV